MARSSAATATATIRRAGANSTGEMGLTGMCNDFGNHVAYAEYAEALTHPGMPIVAPVAAPNLEPKDDIWPSEVATVFRRRDEGVELARLRWGFEPSNPQGRPVINFKSEGRSFANSRRCLVPASHFYEFKGAKAPKSKFKFTLRDEPWRPLERARRGKGKRSPFSQRHRDRTSSPSTRDKWWC